MVVTAGDDSFILLGDDGTEHTILYAEVVQARTVFEWGPQPKGAKAGKPRRGAKGSEQRGQGSQEGSGAPMNSEMMEALENIEREKGISTEIMLEALANALLTAYKRMPDAAEEALVEIDMETGAIKVIAQELDEEGNVTGVGRHPHRLRPHRRADRQAGHLPAHPRGRARR